MRLHPLGRSAALTYAVKFLADAGVQIGPEASQATHILLPVPSFTGDLELPPMDPHTVVIGGNLDRLPKGQPRLDLLQEESYVAKNAMITAHCALGHILPRLPITLQDCPALVIGWGRIGKCLCKLLSGLGARVTVAARKSAHRAMAEALGYQAIDTAGIDSVPYRLIVNTVPVMVLPQGGNALKIDLASQPGIGGDDVLWARGLPGKDAPESSGKLLAETILCKLNQEVIP